VNGFLANTQNKNAHLRTEDRRQHSPKCFSENINSLRRPGCLGEARCSATVDRSTCALIGEFDI